MKDDETRELDLKHQMQLITTQMAENRVLGQREYELEQMTLDQILVEKRELQKMLIKILFLLYVSEFS